MRKLILIIFIAIVCAACQPDSSFVSTATIVQSRGVAIPATFVHPVSDAGGTVPLVVMAHGHGGTRDEAGGFSRVAEALAGYGIASIRVDFPGCGDSDEPFTENNLTNMLADIQASRAFALQHPGIDAERIGILGYSMGGRLALLATTMDDYSALATWAPAAGDGIDSMIPFLGGQEPYEQLRAEAEAAGSTVLETPWGTEQELSFKWFADLEASKPHKAVSHYDGSMLVLYGDSDRVIDPRFARAVLRSASQSDLLVEHAIEGAGHGLGFYSGLEDVANDVVARTASFLRDNL